MLRQLLYVAAIASVAHANNDKVLTSRLGPVVDLGYTVSRLGQCNLVFITLFLKAYIGNSTSNGVDFFGGIPYIQPPVKDLRWRKPRQLDESWKPSSQRELIDARNFGPICIQQPAVIGVGVEGMFDVQAFRYC